MRRWIVAAVASSCAWASTGSVYRSPCVHVGVRPHSDDVGEWAVTVQVANEWGPCVGNDGGPGKQ